MLYRSHGEGRHPVGRLDADTSGSVFSSNGELTQKLLHPKHEIPRSYRAHVLALPDTLHASLRAGLRLSPEHLLLVWIECLFSVNMT